MAKIEVEDRKIISNIIDKHRLMLDSEVKTSMVYQWINGEKESQKITKYALEQLEEIQEKVSRILSRNVMIEVAPPTPIVDLSFFKYFGLNTKATFMQVREQFKKRKLRLTSFVGVDTAPILEDLYRNYKLAETYFKDT